MTVLIFLVVLMVLIVGHELGHFIAAKFAKMRVLEFGIGFPPKLFGRRFKGGETEYTLNWLPFGGFVRIFGEDPREQDSPDAFTSKPKCMQALVLFAGPAANILLAFVLYTFAFSVGVPSVINSSAEAAIPDDARVVVGEVLAGSPASIAGIQAGDAIFSLEALGETIPIRRPEDIQNAIARGGGNVTVVARRSGEEHRFTITPVSGLIKSDPDREAIGVATALVGTLTMPPHRAALEGFNTTIKNLWFVVASLGALLGSALSLSADFSQVAGPIGIASLTGEAAAFGVGSLFSFAALLSINLGIINLFPFPALDGGRLLFLGVETLTRRRIPVKIAGAFNTVGFALLILLMVAVTIGDVSRLLG